MKSGLLGGVCALVLLAVPAAAADPVPKIGPVPSWVEPVKVPPADPGKADQPLQFLVNSAQLRLDPKGTESYLEMVVVPQTVVGLQAVGTIQLPWNVDRTDLTLHKVVLQRGDRTIDLLDSKELLVLRRENNLEKAQLDGIRTVVLPARGLQVGDRLVMALSYTMKPSSIATRPEEWTTQTVPFAFNRLERRIIVPQGLNVQWKRTDGVAAPTVSTSALGTEYRFVAAGAKEREWPRNTPARFKAEQLQVSAWPSWDAVSASMQPLYAKARTLAPGSTLLAEADRIAALPGDKNGKILAALRLAQEQVRYVALLLGEGAYVPVTAEESWARRFGDCKGKTVLLLALLDRLGVEAEPMLVSNALNDSVGTLHPSLAIFDHVIVRAKHGGKTYYLDPTDYGQRSLEELERTAFRHGLPIHAGTNLTPLTFSPPAAPLRESLLEWDGSAGFEQKVPFKGELILRGETAAYMRALKLTSDKPEKFSDELKNLFPGVANEAITVASDEPEQPDGSYRVRFTGSAKMDWSPMDGMKGYRYELDQSTVAWDTDFARDQDSNRNLPVELNYPYYQKSTEIIRLPKGGKGFKVEAPAVARTITGADIRRDVALQGDRVVATSTFRYLKREMSPDEARQAQAYGKKGEDYAYVVAPGRIRAAEAAPDK